MKYTLKKSEKFVGACFLTLVLSSSPVFKNDYFYYDITGADVTRLIVSKDYFDHNKDVYTVFLDDYNESFNAEKLGRITGNELDTLNLHKLNNGSDIWISKKNGKCTNLMGNILSGVSLLGIGAGIVARETEGNSKKSSVIGKKIK